MSKRDDDERQTRPYKPVSRQQDGTPGPRRRTKVQVRPADDASITPTALRQGTSDEAPRRARIKTRTGRRPPTSPVERPADLDHIAALVRRGPVQLVYEQRQQGIAWVLDDKQRLYVYDGEKLVDDYWDTPTAKARDEQLDALLAAGAREPAALRRTFWRTDLDLFVEIELLDHRRARGPGESPWQLLIARGLREGPLHTERVGCAGVAEARKALSLLGRVYQDFIEVENKVPLLRKQRREQGGHAQLPLLRCYLRPARGGSRQACVAVSGCRLYSSSELSSYADRVDAAGVIELPTPAQAEAALERWVADHRRERYFLETLTYDSSRFVG
ncbi:MAG: hypothetical protein KC503_04360 [Myxococcales bacterium]|nr:hypothetical protein [Myxococcales bacterium]